MAAFAERLASSQLPEGSMAAGILEAVERGDISPAQCPMAVIDYLGPSLDTTISGLGNAIWLFSSYPEQWARLREEPSRVKQAFDEVLRLESPISGFTRVATREVQIGGVTLPAGARVLVSFASANRDERHWKDPERFDIERSTASHVAFGFGEHACAGMGLARMEASELLTALAARVERLEPAGPPVRKLNNLIRSFTSLPTRIIPSPRQPVAASRTAQP
jgi:cytochrome P450